MVAHRRPDGTDELVQYFDKTYVTGCSSHLSTTTGVARVCNIPPRFSDLHHTNNVAEGWNNRLRNLVGHHHPTVSTLIEALQADAAEASATVLCHSVGNLQLTEHSHGDSTSAVSSPPV